MHCKTLNIWICTQYDYLCKTGSRAILEGLEEACHATPRKVGAHNWPSAQVLIISAISSLVRELMHGRQQSQIKEELYRRSIIYSDHKPLMYIFQEHRQIPATALARAQWWVLTLSGYHYTIAHKPGCNQGNADGLSRLPLATRPSEVPWPAETVLLIERLNNSLVTAAHIKAWREGDTTLAKVWKLVLQGWLNTIEDPLLQRKMRRTQCRGWMCTYIAAKL